MSPDQSTIAIMGNDIPITHAKMSIDRLYFLADNPRVYATTRRIPNFEKLSRDEIRDHIYKSLLDEPSVKNLEPEIKRDCGLQEPIIVRHDTHEVIEGNSRLAVYKKLWDETKEEQWSEISCALITSLTPEQQTRLLGQTHLRGRTEWSAYAKALLCFRWVDEDKKEASRLAKIMGFSTSEINKHVKTIRLMKENDDDKESNFSYYNVLITNRKISKKIIDNPDLKNTLFTEIKADNTRKFTAQEMRQQLPQVIEKPRILKKFVKGDVDLEEAYDRAKISKTQDRLKRIRKILNDIEQRDIAGLGRNELRAIEQEVRKIGRYQDRIKRMIKRELDLPKS